MQQNDKTKRSEETDEAAGSLPLAQELLDMLLNVQSAAGMLYAREAERMALKHGVGDPRAQRVMQTARGAQDALSAIQATRIVQAGERPLDEQLKEQKERVPAKPPKKPRVPRETVTFSIRGTVTRADGKPASGVLVRAYDKDVRYDDLLGAAITNRKGEFALSYRTQDFAENETTADLYFVVVNASEAVLLTSAEPVEFNDNHEGQVQLVIRGEETPPE